MSLEKKKQLYSSKIRRDPISPECRHGTPDQQKLKTPRWTHSLKFITTWQETAVTCKTPFTTYGLATCQTYLYIHSLFSMWYLRVFADSRLLTNLNVCHIGQRRSRTNDVDLTLLCSTNLGDFNTTCNGNGRV